MIGVQGVGRRAGWPTACSPRRGCRGRGPCREGATSGAWRGGGSAPRWRRRPCRRARGRRSPTRRGGTGRACGVPAGSRRCRCRGGEPPPRGGDGPGGPRPCSALQLVEEARREEGHVLGVGRVVAVLLPEGGGAGQDLLAEVLDPALPPRSGRCRGGGRRAGTRRGRRCGPPPSRGAARGTREGPGPGSRPRPGRRWYFSTSCSTSLAATSSQNARKALAGQHARPRAAASSPRMCPAAKRMSPPRAMRCLASRRGISWRMSSTTLWMWRRRRRTRCSWLPCHEAMLWRMRIEPEGVGARVDRLSLAQEGDVGAAASHLDENGVGGSEGLVVAQRLADGHVGEAVLLGAVDDLDVDAGAQAHPIEERLAIRRLRGRRSWPRRDSARRRRCP